MLFNRKLALGVYHCRKSYCGPPEAIASEIPSRPGSDSVGEAANGYAAPWNERIEEARRSAQRRPALRFLSTPSVCGVHCTSPRQSLELPSSRPKLSNQLMMSKLRPSLMS